MQVLHPSPAAIYNGVIHAFSKISSTEGHLRLWRGILSVALGAGPAHAVYFASFEEAKRLLNLTDCVLLNPIKTGIWKS